MGPINPSYGHWWPRLRCDFLLGHKMAAHQQGLSPLMEGSNLRAMSPIEYVVEMIDFVLRTICPLGRNSLGREHLLAWRAQLVLQQQWLLKSWEEWPGSGEQALIAYVSKLQAIKGLTIYGPNILCSPGVIFHPEIFHLHDLATKGTKNEPRLSSQLSR